MRCSFEHRESFIGNSPVGRAVQKSWPYETTNAACWQRDGRVWRLGVASGCGTVVADGANGWRKGELQPFHVKHSLE